ncbi:cysteine hydrolase family protein [Scleromatobacter humisilvae]|uniref:Cysteine hydrolase n=1 Tax=Scleromatobacter humisilvae TaxID=2897159 RepID=A0A9X1YG93_9BURK|nr:cysteine hydrolase family protein [Scleromatobacter humisilvae]MCK9685478.1 cysteine hydrolase [Scleromatobacter humisilvae]
MKIPAKETALVVIDMQTILFDPEPPEAEAVVARINGLASRAREAGVPVVWVQHETASGDLVAETPGWQLHPGLMATPSDLFVRKKMSDAFLRTELHALLAERGVRHVTVCGYSSEFCVDSSVRGAASRGYAVTLAADAHTSHDKPHATGLQIRLHENETLRNISSFHVAIDAVPAAEIAFG